MRPRFSQPRAHRDTYCWRLSLAPPPQEKINYEKERKIKKLGVTLYPYCKDQICFRVFCVLQMSGLKPIGSNMLKLILEYSKLAAALDTTRHHMSVNGVFLPDNHGMNSD